MPKPLTFPSLYNDALQIHISKSKEWGYLDTQQIKSGTITWSRNGSQIGSISIKVNTLKEQAYVELTYNFREEPRKYKVALVAVPSNLGKGKVWYFVCPYTDKRCRKLYSIGGYFYHRCAFSGAMYETQTYSKKWRQIEKLYGAYFDYEKYYKQLHSKHFTKFYKGKPTKRYLKLLEKLKQAERVDAFEIELLLMS